MLASVGVNIYVIIRVYKIYEKNIHEGREEDRWRMGAFLIPSNASALVTSHGRNRTFSGTCCADSSLPTFIPRSSLISTIHTYMVNNTKYAGHTDLGG